MPCRRIISIEDTAKSWEGRPPRYGTRSRCTALLRAPNVERWCTRRFLPKRRTLSYMKAQRSLLYGCKLRRQQVCFESALNVGPANRAPQNARRMARMSIKRPVKSFEGKEMMPRAASCPTFRRSVWISSSVEQKSRPEQMTGP